MPRLAGKRMVMEMLRAEGVEYIFGNPGTSEGPLLDALEGFPDLKYMLATQEGVAMGMAEAYARSTGKPSFVNLHIQTGLANGISLLHNASESGTPTHSLQLVMPCALCAVVAPAFSQRVRLLPEHSRL